jgi:hypothetical protein
VITAAAFVPQVEYLAARERWEAATKQLLTHETETAALITKVCTSVTAVHGTVSLYCEPYVAVSTQHRASTCCLDCNALRIAQRRSFQLCYTSECICSLAQCNIVKYLTSLLLLPYTLVCGISGLQREQACDELMEASLQACQPPATDVRR